VLGASLPFTACTGWWFEPLSKMMELVSWGYKIPSGKIKVMFQTTNQTIMVVRKTIIFIRQKCGGLEVNKWWLK
jgi:hypothetical protein